MDIEPFSHKTGIQFLRHLLIQWNVKIILANRLNDAGQDKISDFNISINKEITKK